MRGGKHSENTVNRSGHYRFPVTLSFFSPVGIVFTSRLGASWQWITLGVITSFLTIFFGVDLTLNMYIGSGWAVFIFLAAAISLSIVLIVRSRASEIIIHDPKRQIIGIPGQMHPIGYSEVDRLFIDRNEGFWRIFLVLKNGDQVMLAHGFPLNLARKTALQAAEMIGVPLLGDLGQVLRKPANLDWNLPYRLPSGRFPLEYLILAAALAGSIIMVAGISIGSIFHAELAPKWMFLLAIAFPGGQLLANVEEYRGFKTAVSVLGAFFIFIYMLTVLSFVEPASFFLALIPAAVAFLMLIIAYTERRRMLPWLLLAIICVVPGAWFALFSSYQHHIFFNLDPAVIESIDIQMHDGRDVVFESPSDIRNIIRALHSGEIKRSALEPKSQSLAVTINRPAGRNYYIELRREGTGSKVIASYRLACDFLGLKFPLGLMASNTAEKVLLAASSTQAVWPPGY